MPTISYKTSNTVTGLLQGLSVIGLEMLKEHRKHHDPPEFGVEGLPDCYTKVNENLTFSYNVCSINLAGAIIEGAIGDLLSKSVRETSKTLSNTRASKVFQNFFLEKIDLEGGFEKKLNLYSLAFGEHPTKIGKPQDWKAVRSLMTLRNCTAHGSQIVFPDSDLPPEANLVYPYSWQRKLADCSKYLDSHLDSSRISEHIKHPDLMFHFWDHVRSLCESFISKHGAGAKTRCFELAKSYQYGYHWSKPD